LNGVWRNGAGLRSPWIGRVPAADVVQDADVGMMDTGNGARLALETLPALRPAGEVLGQNLDGYGAVERCIVGPIHLSLPAGPDRRLDLVRAKPGSRRQ
jgi:hypothetical protein